MAEETAIVSFEESAQKVTDAVLERSRRILIAALGPGFGQKSPDEINAIVCELMKKSVEAMSNNV